MSKQGQDSFWPKKVKLSVVVDRYYPFIVGGGEISLKHILDNIKDQLDLSVISINNKKENVSRVDVDGVLVDFISLVSDIDLAFIRQPSDSLHLFPNKLLFRLKNYFGLTSKLYHFTALLSFALKYILVKTNVSFFDKLLLFWNNALSIFISRENIEYYDEDYQPIVNNKGYLKSIISSQKPDIIHADNLRSILRVKESEVEEKSIAVVRDLRFICPRRVTIAHTRKGPCLSCDYSCIKEQPLIIRFSLKRIFKRNKSYRQKILKKYDNVITTSNFLKSFLQAELDLPIKVISNPINAEDTGNFYLKDKEETTILYAGMLNKNKGPDLLVKAFSSIVRRFPKIRLIVVGRGEFRKVLENLTKDCRDKVKFKGFLGKDELISVYKCADIVVCPSRWPEPFGRVPLEAMVYRCIVLASCSGGFRETIKDNYNGFLFSPNDLVDLEQKLVYIITNKEKLSYIKENANDIVKNYDVSKISRCYLDEYRRLY